MFRFQGHPASSLSPEATVFCLHCEDTILRLVKQITDWRGDITAMVRADSSPAA